MSPRLPFSALALAILGMAGCTVFGGHHSGVGTDTGTGFGGVAACVPVLYIDTWDVIDPSTLIVYAPGPKDAFLVKFAEPVPDLRARDSIGFVSGSGDGRICGASGDLVARASLHVPIAAVRALKGGEVKRLKASAKSSSAAVH